VRLLSRWKAGHIRNSVVFRLVNKSYCPHSHALKQQNTLWIILYINILSSNFLQLPFSHITICFLQPNTMLSKSLVTCLIMCVNEIPNHMYTITFWPCKTMSDFLHLTSFFPFVGCFEAFLSRSFIWFKSSFKITKQIQYVLFWFQLKSLKKL
jgi:hypothetical protein